METNMKEYKFKINGNAYKVTIDKVENGVADVSVNGTDYKVELEDNGSAKPVIKPAVSPATYQAKPVQPVASAPVAVPAAQVSGAEYQLKSPLPGVILDVKVGEGDTVKEGQTVMILEAMKMENNIDALKGGVIKKIIKRTGDSVMEGDVLLTIE